MRGIVMFLIFSMLVLSGLTGYQLVHARQAHAAICALAADIQTRHDASVAYLKAHPRGVVSPVTNAVIITPEQIQQGIDNQESSLRAINSQIDCS